MITVWARMPRDRNLLKIQTGGGRPVGYTPVHSIQELNVGPPKTNPELVAG